MFYFRKNQDDFLSCTRGTEPKMTVERTKHIFKLTGRLIK